MSRASSHAVGSSRSPNGSLPSELRREMPRSSASGSGCRPARPVPRQSSNLPVQVHSRLKYSPSSPGAKKNSTQESSQACSPSAAQTARTASSCTRKSSCSAVSECEISTLTSGRYGNASGQFRQPIRSLRGSLQTSSIAGWRFHRASTAAWPRSTSRADPQGSRWRQWSARSPPHSGGPCGAVPA